MTTKRTWHNNDIPTLSNLDREMISHVPPGGNWQSIPESVPSKRLDQIREMTKERGVVRTTYYGRLLLNQPSYTISTYYNRPGNGTHIHPIEDRTLTSREAARLQSFPDSYIFSGTEGSIRKQIGNAVPPLLAYHIGKKLRSYSEGGTCVDMFCGAGGLSLGLEWAGWEIVSAIDHDKNALNTYKLNRNNTEETMQFDLQSEEDRKHCLTAIKSRLNGRPLSLLVGGPPCQGFSHAGFRNHDDKRNDLAVNYLTFADELKPEIFLLENVEGLLTMNKGKVIEDLITSLEEIGYHVSRPVWKLNAEQYGVPQMRRRVFLVATRKKYKQLSSPAAICNPCLGRRKKSNQLKVLDAMSSPINIAEAFLGLSYTSRSKKLGTAYSKWISGEISLQEFCCSFREVDEVIESEQLPLSY
ncbi:MAG: DNA (cytosine-5-)-methyltransferase [Colwellia sp.]|jgi:DNA-methyltransferase (dcm)